MNNKLDIFSIKMSEISFYRDILIKKQSQTLLGY